MEVKDEMSLKGYFYFSSDGHFVLQNQTVSAIMLEGSMRNISVKLFQI